MEKLPPALPGSIGPNVLNIIQGAANDVITCITCGSAQQSSSPARYDGSYSQRVVVRVERAPELAKGGSSSLYTISQS